MDSRTPANNKRCTHTNNNGRRQEEKKSNNSRTDINHPTCHRCDHNKGHPHPYCHITQYEPPTTTATTTTTSTATVTTITPLPLPLQVPATNTGWGRYHLLQNDIQLWMPLHDFTGEFQHDTLGIVILSLYSDQTASRHRQEQEQQEQQTEKRERTSRAGRTKKKKFREIWRRSPDAKTCLVRTSQN